MELSRTANSIDESTEASDGRHSTGDTEIPCDPGIQIVIDTYSPVAVGRVLGDVDILTSPSLALALAELAKSDTPFVLDMTNVGFIGTSALSVISDFATSARYEDISWTLAASRSLRHLLAATGIDTKMSVCRSVEEASRRVRAA
ncbi:STAS domain-containing protein [Rhodococcus sp. NPDC058521]|uniref:STAS domain-containing protein n=1 Tax=Rhodococcus sp. NPDC058521 TaxID=3346536 RepID=UPI003649D29A